MSGPRLDQDAQWGHIHTQRRVMADLLAELDPDQWDAPSVCEGWRVRDVAGHVRVRPRRGRAQAAEAAGSRGTVGCTQFDGSSRRPGEGITIEAPSQTEIVIKGVDKQRVGQIAANIREIRPPEPYKGKGVKYSDEKISLKEGKKK